MYKSTRGNDYVTASKAIIQGLSSDKGLFMIDEIPHLALTPELLKLDYKELSFKILRLYLDDFSDEAIKNAINSAYNDSNFPNGMFSLDETMEYAFLNLYLGPTFAFKDMALTILPYLVKEAKKIQNDHRKTVILTATSGDTGSAALSGFKKLKDNLVFVLYPSKGISKFQEAQMVKNKDKNAFPLKVDGNFDDCQKIVKELFNESNYSNIDLSSANSINIGRLIPQIIYYYAAYIKLVLNNSIRFHQRINVSVPTGNFGNILACFMAKLMGLPIDEIICSSNENNVLTDFFKTGIYDANRALKITNSPSMDILVSSNLERYLYLVSESSEKVKALMEELEKNKRYEYKEILDLSELKFNDTDVIKTKEIIYKEFKYIKHLIDPHTAVAFDGYLSNNNKKYTLIVSTASPYKFSDTIIEALNLKKGSSLKEDFKEIYNKTGQAYDSRMEEYFEFLEEKEVYKKEEVKQKLKAMLSDINDRN